MALWYPDAVRVVQADNGSWTGGPPKIVLHSTESVFGKGWATFKPGTHSHFEISQHPGGAVKVRQFYPLDQPSRALQDTSGPVRTNRDHAIQVEMGFQAAKVGLVPDHFWAEVAKLLRWIENNAGVDPTSWAKFLPYPSSYGKSPVRFSATHWDGFNGTCGHMHVPENDHGDPGDIPVGKLRKPAVAVKPPAVNPPTKPAPTLPELLEMKLTDTITIPGTYASNTNKPDPRTGKKADQTVTVEDALRRMYEWSFKGKA